METQQISLTKTNQTKSFNIFKLLKIVTYYDGG